MRANFSAIRALLVFLISAIVAFTSPFPTDALNLTLNSAPVQVYFSPNGGCTEAIIKQIDQAKSEILIQAYSFTSVPIAKETDHARA